MDCIYLDNNATTPLLPAVWEAMLPFLTQTFGNPASAHQLGRRARRALEDARDKVAALLGAHPDEVLFTSGATESDNLALKGVAAMYRRDGGHIVTVATEHKAILDVCTRLQLDGLRVSVLPVDSQGRITAEQVAEALTDNTQTPPDEAAAFRIDFPIWLMSWSERDRRIIEENARDVKVLDV